MDKTDKNDWYYRDFTAEVPEFSTSELTAFTKEYMDFFLIKQIQTL